jgi:hypothetical protein
MELNKLAITAGKLQRLRVAPEYRKMSCDLLPFMVKTVRCHACNTIQEERCITLNFGRSFR